MGFRFSLETVLRVRKIAEDREERLLSKILQQIAQCRQSLVELAARRAGLLLERERALETSIPAAELLFLHAQMVLVEELQESGDRQMAELETLRLHQLGIYAAAHRNYKLLSTMREEQLDCFRAEQARAEQRQMDDRFSATQAKASQTLDLLKS